MAELHENTIPNDKQSPKNGRTSKMAAEEDINKINSIKSENHEIVAHYTKTDDSPPAERVKFEGLDSDDDSMSSESSVQVMMKLPPIPDGGWGWVVVLAAFLVNACADGLSFSYGLLQEQFALYFETSQSHISLIGSLFIATPLLAGPVMSALVDRYGCRVMTMVAGLLSTISFLLASLCSSIEMLCLTFGFMSGLAMGILYVTAVVSVAFWFDKKRNLAVALASSGIGFGTLIYSPMTYYFLQLYDWRNTIVLLAGTLLNMCVCGALMRTPEWLEIKQKRERSLSRRSSSAGSISSRSMGGESLYLSTEELNALLKSGQSPEYILEMLTTTIAEAEQLETTTQMNAEQISRRIHSAINLPTFIQQNEKVPPEVIERLMSNHRLYNIILQNYPDVLTRRRSEVNLNVEGPPADVGTNPGKLPVQIKYKLPKDPKLDTIDKAKDKTKEEGADTRKKSKENVVVSVDENQKPTTKLQSASNKTSRQTHNQPQSGWLARQISTDHHYFQKMPLYRGNMMYRGTMMSIPRYRLKASSLPDIYKNSMWSLESESDDEMRWYHRLLEILKKMFNFAMFTELHFFIFNLSELFFSVWMIVPYFFLKSYMTAQNMEGGEVMISIIGISSAIGIVVLGWLGDQTWVHVTKVYACCLFVCGASVAAYPFFITNWWLLALNSAVFGFSFASSYSFTPAILMKLIPIDYFTVAYGLSLLVQGVGHLVGPPLGGLLYDNTGSWDLTFYVGGSWVVASGLCLMVIAVTSNRRLCGNTPLLNDQKKFDIVDV